MGRGEYVVSATPRLDVVVEDLQDPERQQPTLWLFLGGRAKAKALKCLVPSIVCPRLQRRGGFRLHSDPEMTYRDRPNPWLVVEGDLIPHHVGHPPLGAHSSISRQHRIRADARTSTLPPASFICSQLFQPFVDVVVLFLSDYADQDAVARLLTAWTQRGDPSSRPVQTLPCLILVASDGEAEASMPLVASLTRQSGRTFSRVEVMDLGKLDQLSSPAYHRPLKERILLRSDEVRAARRSCRHLFTARHLQEFLHYRLEHLDASERFDFVHWSRHHRPVSASVAKHVGNLVSHYRCVNTLQSGAVSVVASALLMDHYVHRMHRK